MLPKKIKTNVLEITVLEHYCNHASMAGPTFEVKVVFTNKKLFVLAYKFQKIHSKKSSKTV